MCGQISEDREKEQVVWSIIRNISTLKKYVEIKFSFQYHLTQAIHKFKPRFIFCTNDVSVMQNKTFFWQCMFYVSCWNKRLKKVFEFPRLEEVLRLIFRDFASKNHESHGPHFLKIFIKLLECAEFFLYQRNWLFIKLTTPRK